jgi:hypothetical protein
VTVPLIVDRGTGVRATFWVTCAPSASTTPVTVAVR